MRYIIDKSLHTPAYLQLYEQLREDIVRGAYPLGAKLPSKRSTALETGVSTVTVEHAFDLLREEGYVESRERSGFSVVYQSADGFAPAAVDTRAAETRVEAAGKAGLGARPDSEA
ncbi:MAG: GntR family transcriptional regulator, partial [Coriobacteriales bacterium]